MPEEAATVERLHRLEIVRERAWMVLAAVERGQSDHFAITPEAVPAVALALAQAIRATGVHGLVPPLPNLWHRLGRDYPAALEALAAQLDKLDPVERGRSGADLALLELTLAPAGLGGADGPLGLVTAFFAAGGCTAADGRRPALDAPGLRRLLAGDAALPVPEPLASLLADRERRQRLEQLASGLEQDPERFGAGGRFGLVLDRLAAEARNEPLAAQLVIDTLAPLIDLLAGSTVRVGGSLTGDVWRHPVAWAEDRSRELVPFHCLLQALALGLVEPLQEAGLSIADLDQLTVPATRELAAVMLRLGLVRTRHAAVARLRHPPGSDIVVELRALSVALADRLADRLRQELGLTAHDLPAVRIVEPLAQLATNWREQPGPGIAIMAASF